MASFPDTGINFGDIEDVGVRNEAITRECNLGDDTVVENKSSHARSVCPQTQKHKIATLTQYRFVSLTSPTQIIPLNIPSNDPISVSVTKDLAPMVPLGPPISYSSSPHKVHIRSVASLASGHVIEYMYARDHGLEPKETYQQVNEVMDTCFKALTNTSKPHTWLHCDSIAMASWFFYTPRHRY